MGDIGCYTLGALPPLLALDSCLCMGASVGMMAGFNKALGRKAAVGVIGDSTFFHSGITPLIDAFYNEVEGMLVILDNRTTAMTGHQGHPGTGLHPDRAQGPASTSRSSARASACAASPSTRPTTRRSTWPSRKRPRRRGLGVIVALAPCVLMTREQAGEVMVDDDRCNLCGLCVDLGCPAIAPGEDAISVLESLHRAAACASRSASAVRSASTVRRGRAMNGTTTVSLVGVGGQGILLGAAVLAETAAGRRPRGQGQRGQGHGPARRQRAQHGALRRARVVAGRRRTPTS